MNLTPHNRNYYPTNNKQIIVNNYYGNASFKTPANRVNYIYKNNNNSSNTGVSSNISNENSCVELCLINNLSTNGTVCTILSYLKEFSLGNFTNVRNVFSEFSKFATDLYNLQSTDVSCNGHNVRLTDASYNDYHFVLNSIIVSFES
jgi:hypothetical protein